MTERAVTLVLWLVVSSTMSGTISYMLRRRADLNAGIAPRRMATNRLAGADDASAMTRADVEMEMDGHGAVASHTRMRMGHAGATHASTSVSASARASAPAGLVVASAVLATCVCAVCGVVVAAFIVVMHQRGCLGSRFGAPVSSLSRLALA